MSILNEKDYIVYDHGATDDILITEEILLEKLELDPHNISLILKLAHTYLGIPLVDIEKSLLNIEKALLLDPLNEDALLLKASIYHFHLKGINQMIYDQLLALSKSRNNPELQASLLYTASWYPKLSLDEREILLRKAIKMSNKHVHDHVDLTKILVQKKQFDGALFFAEQGLKNIQKIYYADNSAMSFLKKNSHADLHDLIKIPWNYGDYQERFDKHITGITCNDFTFQKLFRLVKKLRTINYQYAHYLKKHFKFIKKRLDHKLFSFNLYCFYNSNKPNSYEHKNTIGLLQKILEYEIERNPYDVSLWLKLATTKLERPLVDNPTAVDCCYQALKINPNCAEAWILITFSYYFYEGGIDYCMYQELSRLSNFYYATNKPLSAMLKYCSSLYYDLDKKFAIDNQEKIRRDAIAIYDGHVYDHKSLARILIEKNQLHEALYYAEKGIANIKTVYPNATQQSSCKEYHTDYIELFNIEIKGIYTNQTVFEIHQEFIQEIKNKINEQLS